MQQVMVEARSALAAKAELLGLEPIQSAVISTTQPASPSKEIRLTVSNRLGLHARPAAQFVTTAARFQSQIRVRNVTRGTNAVRGDSINQVATLGVRQGHELVITATGADADEALAALETLIANNFGEDDSTLASLVIENKTSQPSTGELSGIAASPGVAIAPVVHYQPPTVTPREYHVENFETEWQRLQTAIATAKQQIQTLFSHASVQIGDAEAAIFVAHLLFLEDPVLLEAVRQRIYEHQMNAEAAWQAVVDEVASNYHKLEDAYLQERVEDVTDVGQRVLRLLTGTSAHSLELDNPAILVATDLTPSDTIGLDPSKVLGICTTSGSATSHSAIIARTLGW